MAGKTPSEAVQNFLQPLQLALSCVTNAIVLASGYRPSPIPQALTLSDNPTPLGRDKRFALKVIQHYRVIEHAGARGPWKVSTVAYYYTLEEAGEQGKEIVAYHWHPRGHSPITFPHFHLYHGVGSIRDEVREAHFPTGRIAIEDVIRLVITQFGVRPFRDDWEAILDSTQAAFEEWRLWS